MKPLLPARIALRYLFARKSHSAVTAISAVSICGIAVATAAIVCVLSVFNGFRDILTEKLDTLAPDVMVTPSRGKTFADTDSVLGIVRSVSGVQTATPVVADNALVICNGREMPVLLKGVVADEYRRVTSIERITRQDGRFATVDSTATQSRLVYDDDIGDYVEMPSDTRYAADIAIGVASRMATMPGGEGLLVFAPRRTGHVNTANLAASFTRDSLTVAGVFQAMQSDYDSNYVITDIALAREIFQYDSECTGIEILAAPGIDASQLAEDISRALGSTASVKDRLQQQEVNFRMISIEKWVAFLLLTFILTVASFNIVSTISMLILDKQNSLATLHALGASRRQVGRIFAWQSLAVTAIGCGAGMAIGVTLCLVQQHFGIIKLAGDASRLVVKAYPVAVHATDMLTVLVLVVLIGIFTAAVSSRFARSRIGLPRQ